MAGRTAWLRPGGWLLAPAVPCGSRVAGRKRRHENLLDIGCEASPVDRAVEHAPRIDPVAAQRSDQGQRLPVAIRNPGLQSLAARRPAPDRRHVGLRPGLVDEDQPSRIDAALILLPLSPPARDIRAALLAWQNGFLEAQPLGVDEVPGRPVVDLRPPVGEFGPKSAQGDVVAAADPLQKPATMRCG